MTATEWTGQWRRLAHFQIRADADRPALEIEWFAQLKHHHVDAVDVGITQLIGQAKDNFLPGLGLLKDLIQTRLGRYDTTPGRCATCHGALWIDAPPWKAYGRIYTGFCRCPDCGVPAPAYTPNGRREALTASEHQAYLAGTFTEPPLPSTAPNPAALEVLQHLDARRGVTRQLARVSVELGAQRQK